MFVTSRRKHRRPYKIYIIYISMTSWVDLAMLVLQFFFQELLIFRNCRYWTTIAFSCQTNWTIKILAFYGKLFYLTQNLYIICHGLLLKASRSKYSDQTTIAYSCLTNWTIKIMCLYGIYCICKGYYICISNVGATEIYVFLWFQYYLFI